MDKPYCCRLISSYKADETSVIAELLITVLLMEGDTVTENLLLLVCTDGMNVNETGRMDANIGIMRFLTWGTVFRIQKRNEM